MMFAFCRLKCCLPVFTALWLACSSAYTVGAQSTTPPSQNDTLATVRVGSQPGLTIPANFMGFSHEWDTASTFGNSRVGINYAYRQLLANLTVYGSGPLNIRVGGDSTDDNKDATPLAALTWAEIAQALGVHFELGVNLGANDPQLAAAQAKAFVHEMPKGSLDAIEIGNEPDHYHKNGKRSPDYKDADYLAEFAVWKKAVLPVLPPGLKLMGPAWGGPYKLTRAESFELPNVYDLAIFSWHYYCIGPKPAPPEDYLLTPSAATDGPNQVAPSVSMAHAHGTKIRMGELNSIWSAGSPGISDAFQSALWVIDSNFEYAKVGIDGVNWISTGGNYYSSFYFSRTKRPDGMTSYTLDSVHPIYYGLLFFQTATGHGARLLPVDTTTQANVKTWATVDNTGTTHVVVINKDEAHAGPVVISAPGFHHASVLRLTAPSFRSTTGVEWAGYTFDGSTDGKLRKVPHAKPDETIKASDGTFTVSMPITSAALITLTK